MRTELGLGRYAAFDSFALADHPLIPHEPIGDYAGDHRCGWAVVYLAGEGRDEFSAATVYRGTWRCTLYNGQNPAKNGG